MHLEHPRLQLYHNIPQFKYSTIPQLFMSLFVLHLGGSFVASETIRFMYQTVKYTIWKMLNIKYVFTGFTATWREKCLVIKFSIRCIKWQNGKWNIIWWAVTLHLTFSQFLWIANAKRTLTFSTISSTNFIGKFLHRFIYNLIAWML